MATKANSLLVRMTPEQRAWLERTAAEQNRSASAQIRHLIQEAMDREPLRIYVLQDAEAQETHTVTIGKTGHPAFAAADFASALAFAKDKARERGLDTDAIIIGTKREWA